MKQSDRSFAGWIHGLTGKVTLRSRLLLSFIAVVSLVGTMSALLGVRMIHRALPSVKDVLAVDLSAAREVYRQYVTHIADSARRMAQRRTTREALGGGNMEDAAAPLRVMRQSAELDIVTLADLHGQTLFPGRGHASVLAPLAEQALRERREVSATIAVSEADLAAENPELAERAHIDAVATPHAAPAQGARAAGGLVAAVAIPVTSEDGDLLGVLCAGQLLNRRNAVVDQIRNTLYREETFEDRDVAVVSIFLGDKRIATSAATPSGERAVGTLISEDVYRRVVQGGQQWIQPGYIGDDWYLTAYNPIRDQRGQVIGALGFGLLERKFEDTERRALGGLFGLTVLAVALAILVSYLLSKSVMRPVNALIRATDKLAAGGSPRPIKVYEGAPPEIEALCNAFNSMAAAIRARDQKLQRQTHEKLMRSDRLAMIGQLAAGVAHEINNPLGSILLFSRLIIQQVPPQGRIRENLDRIEKETKRCHTIVKSLLDFARERKPLVESLHINEVLDATLKLFEGQFLFQNVEVVREYGANLPAIEADHSQLEQVFMNIILNAVDAMNGRGRLVLATREGEQAGFVEAGISDTGSGISQENLDRIFDPFFTTKGVGHGTGLGLSVSYGIVQAHGGDIAVTSTPGSGATFTVSLPAKVQR
jgi:two-component system, NtrC family, sensor kinase